MNNPPRLRIGSGKVLLTGEWTLAALLPELPQLQAQMAAGGLGDLSWDLSGVERLDSAAAVLLWRTWNGRWPADLIMPHSTRRRVARAFAALRGKKLTNPWKKHDNIPL